MSAPVALLRVSVLAALTGMTHGAATVTQLDAKCLTLQCRQAAAGVLSSLDNRSNPCDDFYGFACGHFVDSHTIPEGKLLWDNFQILQEAMDTRSRDILNASVKPGEAAAVTKAKNMFAACMDTDSQDRRGLDPVVELLQQWGGWPVLKSGWTPLDWHRMGDIVAEFAVPFIFSLSSLASLDNANTTAVYLDAPSLVLPSPLLFNTETPDILRTLSRAEGGVEGLPFTKYLVKMATLLRDHLRTNVSDESIQKDMADVVLYMQSLSRATQVLKMDNTPIDKRGMAWTIGQLNQWTKETLENTTMDWVQFLQRAFSKSGVTVRPDHPVIFLGGEKALAGIISFIEGSDPRVLANYAMSRLLVFLTPESSREMRDAAFEFYVQQGYITTDYPRWLYCVHKVQDYPNVGFSHAVAYHYKTNMMDTQILEEAAEMVSDLRAAFHDLLAENKWMDDETRHSAVQKADAMLVLLGLPSWCDSSAELDEFYNKEVSRPHDENQDETGEIINEDATNYPGHEIVQIEGPEASTSTPHQRRKSVFRSPTKKRRPSQSRADEAYNIMKEAVEKRNQRDPSTIYGEHVASHHRAYSAHTRSVVEHLIGDILFRADMGQYENKVHASNNSHSLCSVPSPQFQMHQYYSTKSNVYTHTPPILSPSPLSDSNYGQPLTNVPVTDTSNSEYSRDTSPSPSQSHSLHADPLNVSQPTNSSLQQLINTFSG